jgi:hypothetical protein
METMYRSHRPDSCVTYVVQCRCGSKRFCRLGYAWCVDKLTDSVLLGDTMFSFGLPSPITEEQHFLMLHEDCPQ